MASTADSRQIQLRQRLQALLPVLLLGTLALFTYWLVKSSPIINDDDKSEATSAKPNAYFHQFSLTSFGPEGEWELKVAGARATHRADIERYDIEAPRMSRRDPQTGVQTQVSAQRAQVNESGSKVQLFGNAVVQRPPYKDRHGKENKAFEIRSDYLLLDDDRQALETNRPVVIQQGQNRFSAERMQALQQDGKLMLDGRVRGTLVPPPKTPAGKNQ